MVTLPLDGEVAIAQLFPFEGVELPKRGDTGEGSAAPEVSGPVRASFVSFGPNLTSPMHHDVNIGVGVVVNGAVELILEDGSVRLEVGDMLLNPGVEHAWSTGDEGAVLAFT